VIGKESNLRTAVKINVISIKAKPTSVGKYVNYDYDFRPIADTTAVSIKLVTAYDEKLTEPIVSTPRPITTETVDYSAVNYDDLV
jgi:hypothetical protein